MTVDKELKRNKMKQAVDFSNPNADKIKSAATQTKIDETMKLVMKLVKLSDDHYILVDNSEIKKGDWIVFPNLKKFVPVQYLGGDLTGFEKKITESSQPIEEWKSVSYGGDGTIRKKIYDKIKELPLQEVKELLGVVDVEKMAEEALISHPDFKAEGYSDYQNGRFNGIVEGYNKACEKYRFTEEDIINWTMSMIAQYVHGNTNIWNRDLLRESLPKPKTEWDVEFEDGKLKLK